MLIRVNPRIIEPGLITRVDSSLYYFFWDILYSLVCVILKTLTVTV